MNQPPKKHITNSGEVLFTKGTAYWQANCWQQHHHQPIPQKTSILHAALLIRRATHKTGQHIKETLHSACNNKINFTAGNIKQVSENRKKCEKCIIPVKIQKLLKRGVTKEYTHVPRDFISTAFIREKKTETQRTI